MTDQGVFDNAEAGRQRAEQRIIGDKPALRPLRLAHIRCSIARREEDSTNLIDCRGHSRLQTTRKTFLPVYLLIGLVLALLLWQKNHIAVFAASRPGRKQQGRYATQAELIVELL